MLKCRESGGEVLGGGLSGLPVVGEEFLEAVHGVGADAMEDVAEVGERLDLESLTNGDEASENVGRGRDCGYSEPPAQIPACGTTALGSSPESWRQTAVPTRRQDSGTRKPACRDLAHPFPCDSTLLASAPEHPEPAARHLSSQCLRGENIRQHGVVGVKSVSAWPTHLPGESSVGHTPRQMEGMCGLDTKRIEEDGDAGTREAAGHCEGAVLPARWDSARGGR